MDAQDGQDDGGYQEEGCLMRIHLVIERKRSALMVSLSNHAAISSPEGWPLQQRDCHASLAMDVGVLRS